MRRTLTVFVLCLVTGLLFTRSALAQIPGGDSIATYATAPGPVGLTFNPVDGRLYVTSSGAVRGVYRVDTVGGAASAFAIGAPFVNPWGIVCDPSGTLFVADRGDPAVANGSMIIRITPAGTATTFVTGLPGIFGLAIDASGNLYAGSYNGQKVVRITPAGVVSNYATGLGVVGNQTYQLEFDAAGNLYVGNEDRILRMAPGGSPATQVVGGLSEAMGFVRWTGDNFIVSTFGFGRLLYTSPTLGVPPVPITSVLLANPCTDGPIPDGTRVTQPVFMTLHDDIAYFADQNCNRVRRFKLPSQSSASRRTTWGTLKSYYR